MPAAVLQVAARLQSVTDERRCRDDEWPGTGVGLLILCNRCKYSGPEAPVKYDGCSAEELRARRGDDEVTLSWLAAWLQAFVDLNPEFEVPVDRLATWLGRAEDDDMA